VATKTSGRGAPAGYDPSQFPAFAVTVDIVILTMSGSPKRELAEETGVDSASLLTQFGAYGDPGRDPRMNVVTVAYLAVLRDTGPISAGSDASHAALVPVSEALSAKIELAFDHARIVRDAVERARVDLEHTGIATAFVGPTFTIAELRAVYEGIWGVHLDGANFRRTVIAEDGWVIPTGRRARPGSRGGKPAELFRAGRMWKLGGPIRRSEPNERRKGDS
jgi:8-oxo-dGTP diphosphatase